MTVVAVSAVTALAVATLLASPVGPEGRLQDACTGVLVTLLLAAALLLPLRLPAPGSGRGGRLAAGVLGWAALGALSAWDLGTLGVALQTTAAVIGLVGVMRGADPVPADG